MWATVGECNRLIGQGHANRKGKTGGKRKNSTDKKRHLCLPDT